MKSVQEMQAEIELMDIFQKAKVWNHYMVTIISLRNFPHFFWNTGSLTVVFFDSPLIEFFDWIDKEKMTRIIDNGPDWKERGFAQQTRVDRFGIYEWYWKFYNELNQQYGPQHSTGNP